MQQSETSEDLPASAAGESVAEPMVKYIHTPGRKEHSALAYAYAIAAQKTGLQVR
jgi:hypothetical protein